MIKNLYLAIEQKLMAITEEPAPGAISERPARIFKHFDLWNRQVEFIEQETPFQTPAIFTEFMPFQWRQLGQNVQEADITVRFHIVTPWYANTAADVTEQHGEIRNTALAYLDLPTVLFRNLQGQHGTVEDNSDPRNPNVIGNFNAMTRVGSIVNHDHERFVDSIEEYTCHLKDFSYGIRTFQVETVGLSIEFDPHPGQS
ncbi:MAG: hypothetical protein J5831_01030 [Bacteroidales bacterium]|nr:hypothetical protein [Bacteroidales bacterium]